MNIGYKLVKNCMAATAEKAPYLGMAIPVGSLAYDNILKEMIKAGTKMTQPTAKYFLDALYEFAAEQIAADAVRINLGIVSIYPMIDGSFDSEDAPFDPQRNSLYVGATLSQELRDRVAGISPDFAGDASLGTVKLHSCMDLETEVFKVICGTETFCLAGANVTVPDGADESLGLYAKNGVDKVADIVVSETDGGQQLFCHLSDAVAVPKGTYKVRLASHGLDPTDPLTVATLTVTLVEAVPEPVPVSGPVMTKLYPENDPSQVGIIPRTGWIKIEGSGLDDLSMKVDYTDKEGVEHPDTAVTTGEYECHGTSITFGGAMFEGLCQSALADSQMTIKVTSAEGSASIAGTIKD